MKILVPLAKEVRRVKAVSRLKERTGLSRVGVRRVDLILLTGGRLVGRVRLVGVIELVRVRIRRAPETHYRVFVVGTTPIFVRFRLRCSSCTDDRVVLGSLQSCSGFWVQRCG